MASRRLLRAVGLLAFQVVAALLLLEATLRLVGRHHPDLATLLYMPSVRHDFDRFDDLETLMGQTVVGFRPGQPRAGFRLNSRSFRTREYTAPRRPGDLRIMALGDSFTDASGGVPFERMWTARLESRLRGALRRPVDVFGLGVPGVGPMFLLRLFELEQRLLRPDLVVLAFFVGNDFLDEQDRPVEPWSGDAAARYSFAYRALRNLARELGAERAARRAAERAGAQPTDAFGVDLGSDSAPTSELRTRTPERFLEIEANRFEICRRDSQPFHEQAAAIGKILRRLDRQVRAAGAQLVVMLIPDEFQVDPALAATLVTRLGLEPSMVDVDQPQAVLGRILDEAGIATLDLLPAFRARSASERLYWPRNTHWNPRGHDFAAELLSEFLLSGALGDAHRKAS